MIRRMMGRGVVMMLLGTAVFFSALVPIRLSTRLTHNTHNNVKNQRDAAFGTTTTRTTMRRQGGGERGAGPRQPYPPRLTESETCALARTNFGHASGLYVIVTGMEHSGTTLVSELLMSAPGLFGAFEGGFLLDDSPARFYKRGTFYKWSVQPVTSSLHWGLTKQQRDGYVTKATCFAEMYRRVHDTSPLFGIGTTQSSSWMVDKTPSYIYNLTRILQITPGVPVVVTVKDDAAQLHSLVKRGVRRKGAVSRLHAGQHALQAALASPQYAHRIHVVNMTRLYADPNEVMAQLFDNLQLSPWNPDYLSMEALNAKGAPLGRCLVPPFLGSTNSTAEAAGPASKVVGEGCQDNNGYAAGKRRKKMMMQQKAAQMFLH